MNPKSGVELWCEAKKLTPPDDKILSKRSGKYRKKIIIALDYDPPNRFNKMVFDFIKQLKDNRKFLIYCLLNAQYIGIENQKQINNNFMKIFKNKLIAREQVKIIFVLRNNFFNLIQKCDIYIPNRFSANDKILYSLTLGIKVLQYRQKKFQVGEIQDFIQGYKENSDRDWYAKIFNNVTHVANPSKIILGLGVTINPRAIILNYGDDKGGWINIGRGSHIGADCLLNTNCVNLSVGNFSMISSNFSAHGCRHTISHISNYCVPKGPFKFFGVLWDAAESINIGNDVWIGDNVKCLMGVSIGNGCVVGTGSVITKNLEPYGIYAGNPAKFIRYRFEREKINFLQSLEWWNWDFNKIKEKKDIFKIGINDLSVLELKKLTL
jgi:virginiamycin A acetyltransferase